MAHNNMLNIPIGKALIAVKVNERNCLDCCLNETNICVEAMCVTDQDEQFIYKLVDYKEADNAIGSNGV